jgi:lysophospholipase L1-like esterase
MRNEMVKNSDPTTPHPKTGKIKLFFFWFLLVIISLIVMELLSFAIITLTKRKGPYRDEVGQVRHPFHPYLGYVQAPNFTFTTIVVTGGSTMFGVGSSDNSTTVPSILERLINERLNIRTEVVNLALRGGQSFQEMLLVDQFFAENHANLVLAISGRNDASQAFFEPTVEGAFLKKHVWDNAVSLVQRAERGEFMLINFESKLRSWSYTFDLLYRQFDKFRKKGESRSSSGLPKPSLRREVSTSINKRAKITATHYAATDQISEMNGARFIMFLQPTPYYKNDWTEEEVVGIRRKYESEDMMEKYRRHEHEFYNAFRKIEKPFHFVDLSSIFSESNETLYIDQCHYNDLAAEKFAERILASIQPFLEEFRGL